MKKMSKRCQANRKNVNRLERLEISQALDKLKATEAPKFDETVEVALNLGVNPKYSDQMVRGAVVLPHGTGKQVRVLAFVKDAEKQAHLESLLISGVI